MGRTNVSFKEVDRGWKGLLKKLEGDGSGKKGLSQYAKVGFPAESSTSSVLTKATANEYGVPSKNIPERPFMQRTFDENESKYTNRLIEQSKKITDPKAVGVNVKTLLVGLAKEVETDLKQTIASSRSWAEPNRPWKKAMGKGHLPPLILSYEMLNSISSFMTSERPTIFPEEKRSGFTRALSAARGAMSRGSRWSRNNVFSPLSQRLRRGVTTAQVYRAWRRSPQGPPGADTVLDGTGNAGIEFLRGFMSTAYSHEVMSSYGSFLGGSGIQSRIGASDRWLEANPNAYSPEGPAGGDWY